MHQNYHRQKHPSKREYRKKYQKYKSTRDVEVLQEPIYTKRKKEKTSNKVYTSRALQPETEIKPDNKVTITVDISTFLLLLQGLLENKQITKEQVAELLKDVKKTEDEYILTDKDHPKKEFHITNKTSKDQLRDYWITLMNRGKLFCDICGNPIKTLGGPGRLTYDHITPKSKGGKTDGYNGSPAHSICNGLKGNMLPEEWEIYGLQILHSRGIKVDFAHTMYQYKQIKSR